MVTRIKDIQDLKSVVSQKVAELSVIEEGYLSETGKAALEAYMAISWYVCFVERLADLITFEDYLNLLDIEDKHPEYYNVLRTVNKYIENIVY